MWYNSIGLRARKRAKLDAKRRECHSETAAQSKVEESRLGSFGNAMVCCLRMTAARRARDDVAMVIESTEKRGYVYLLTNKANSVLYTGVTSNLAKRIYEHKKKVVDGFTKKYNVEKLVHYELFDSIEEAISREKQIKGWLRRKKNDLIESTNPEWKDLYDEVTSF